MADEAACGIVSGRVAEIASDFMGMQPHAKLLQSREKPMSAIEIGRHIAFSRHEGGTHMAAVPQVIRDHGTAGNIIAADRHNLQAGNVSVEQDNRNAYLHARHVSAVCLQKFQVNDTSAGSSKGDALDFDLEAAGNLHAASGAGRRVFRKELAIDTIHVVEFEHVVQ